MSKRIDLTGQKFGRLTVISYNSTNNDNKATWNCICECGNLCVKTGKSASVIKFTSPSQEIYVCKNVSCFCKKHNICRKSIYVVLKGNQKLYKGWQAEYLWKQYDDEQINSTKEFK